MSSLFGEESEEASELESSSFEEEEEEERSQKPSFEELQRIVIKSRQAVFVGRLLKGEHVFRGKMAYISSKQRMAEELFKELDRYGSEREVGEALDIISNIDRFEYMNPALLAIITIRKIRGLKLSISTSIEGFNKIDVVRYTRFIDNVTKPREVVKMEEGEEEGSVIEFESETESESESESESKSESESESRTSKSEFELESGSEIELED